MYSEHQVVETHDQVIEAPNGHAFRHKDHSDDQQKQSASSQLMQESNSDMDDIESGGESS
jgi:hypothetical protein